MHQNSTKFRFKTFNRAIVPPLNPRNNFWKQLRKSDTFFFFCFSLCEYNWTIQFPIMAKWKVWSIIEQSSSQWLERKYQIHQLHFGHKIHPHNSMINLAFFLHVVISWCWSRFSNINKLIWFSNMSKSKILSYFSVGSSILIWSTI